MMQKPITNYSGILTYGKGGDGMTGIHVAQVMTGIQQNAREKIIPNISPCMPYVQKKKKSIQFEHVQRRIVSIGEKKIQIHKGI